MTGSTSSPRDAWIVSLGRWWGVHVGIHLFFVLFGVFTGYLAWIRRSEDLGLMWLALLSMVLLLVSVVVHELGHLFAARKLGGYMDAISLGPLGGLRPARVPQDPQGELLALMAGPATTLGVCLICLVATSLLEPAAPSGLLNPLAPEFLNDDSMEFGIWQVIRLACWINWWLFVVNLIPAFPFDGGRAFVALLEATRPQMDHGHAVRIVATFARLVALALFILAFAFHDALPGSTVPTWMAFLLLSIFVFFSARVEETQRDHGDDDEEAFGYDFSQGYTSLERTNHVPKPGPITRWVRRYRERQRHKQAAIAAAEDKRSDEILARLHEHGMESLTVEERAILKRVSARLRTKERG